MKKQVVYSTKKVPKRTEHTPPPDAEQSSSAIPSMPKKTSRKKSRHQLVKGLKPSKALLQFDFLTVSQCVEKMTTDDAIATLLTNEQGQLTGILTDRDIALKVVAAGKDPKVTIVSHVMTKNPSCVKTDTTAIDALKKMITGQFRHLPVIENEQVVGILDIAKCLYESITKIANAYNNADHGLSETVKKLERQIQASSAENLFETLRQKLFVPTLSALLNDESDCPVMFPSSSAMAAAELMLQKNISAVMVCDPTGRSLGIFTTKDLMRRVVSVDKDPTSVILLDVMTPNPHSAQLKTTILETLQSMHNGRFLHVPVYNDEKELVGLVDVLQVSYGIVQQMATFQTKNESVRPLWDEYRSSLDASDSSSRLSSSHHHSQPDLTRLEDPIDEDPIQEHTPDVFVYKVVDWYGTTHRFTSSAESVQELLRDVQTRLGDHTIRKMDYVDDEGDQVLLFKDDDLKDAVRRARTWGNKYIRLMIPHRRLYARPSGFEHAGDGVFGIVYYAAAAAAIAGASFFLSRRR